MTTRAPSALDGVQPICHPLCTVKDQITRTECQDKLFLSGFVSTSGTLERKVTNSGGSGNLPYTIVSLWSIAFLTRLSNSAYLRHRKNYSHVALPRAG